MTSPRPVNPDPKDGETGINIYGYTPSLALAVSAVVLFGVIGLAHVGWSVVWGKRTRVYHSLLAFGCAMEVVGYAFRLRAHYNPFLLVPFVVQYFMIVVAPVFFSAAIYLSLTILINGGLCTPAFLSGRTIFITFLTADVFTTILQVAGAALVGVGYSRQADGQAPPLVPEDANKILVAGLAVQTFAFTLFVGLFTRVIWGSRAKGRNILVLLGTIWIASVLLLMRIVFRLAESAEGADSRIAQDESLFLIEYEPVVIALFILTAWPLGWRVRHSANAVK